MYRHRHGSVSAVAPDTAGTTDVTIPSKDATLGTGHKDLPGATGMPPPVDRSRLRASVLIGHLLDAELHYALSSNTIMFTFKTPAAAEWCVGALTVRDLL